MKKSLVLALYLPQFHRIPENDKWWGEGFTEWNAVKMAKKLSKYSVQPRVPLNGYYDLSQKESIQQQAKLAKSSRIDGFMIYHYYSNGKKLLNKPAEIILEEKDIDIQFCFSWANHDWKRTWYGYNKELLLKQEYGSEEQIVEHFEYLVEFFKDRRYIKINNKPVISIYKLDYIKNFSLYHEIWNRLARERGFEGIYFVQMLDSESTNENLEYFDACYYFEPGYTMRSSKLNLQRFHNTLKSKLFRMLNIKRIANYYNYKLFADIISNRKIYDNKHLIGVFPDWDNTPRHSYNGVVFKNTQAKVFELMFKESYKKACDNNHEMIIINAWNEWSEGAYIEPDNIYQYKRLEAIRNVVEEMNGGM